MTFRDEGPSALAKAERLEVENAELRRRQLTIVDWIGVLVVALGVAFLMVFPFAVADRFAAVFRELGGPLPAVSRLVLTPWFSPAVALVPVGLLVAAFTRRPSLGVWRALVAGAFATVLVSTTVCMVGLYAPIVALAGAIKAD